MKLSSTLRLCCAFASFSLGLAGRAGAAQEIYTDLTPSAGNLYNVYGGLASCAGLSVPWNCTNSHDKVAYTENVDWGYYSFADLDRVSGYRVSRGDYAWAQVTGYCSDGTIVSGINEFGDGGGDGQPPPTQIAADCYGPGVTFNEIIFAYGVEATGAS